MVYTEENLHPELVALIALCKKIGLNQAEQFLLFDLTGWHDRGKKIPFSHNGVEPHITIIANTAKLNRESPNSQDRFIAESIAEILRKIIGPELMNQVTLDPVETLRGIEMNPVSTAWLIAQLHLTIESEEVLGTIREMSSMSPERFHCSGIVMSTISLLLQRRA